MATGTASNPRARILLTTRLQSLKLIKNEVAKVKGLRPLVVWIIVVIAIIFLFKEIQKPAIKQQAVPAGTVKAESSKPVEEISSFIKSEFPAQLNIFKPAKKEKRPCCLKEFGIFTGTAEGTLEEKEDYRFVPLIVRFGFDLSPFLNKLNIQLDEKQLFLFELEPFFNTVISPDSNIEIGSNFLFKYGYFIDKKICPYVEAGAGIIYVTQHTIEQSTQFNFIPQFGGGVSYFIKDNTAVSLGYRCRHLSNSSIKQPNKGINVNMFLVGFSWFY